MANNTASNYSGKQGKTNIQQQGQTAGAFGSTPNLCRRQPHPPTDLRP